MPLYKKNMAHKLCYCFT